MKTSRLETGVIQLDKKPGRLFDTVAQAMSGIVYAAEKKEIAVSVDCPEDLAFSHDSKWTSEALFNLLDNAVKYTPAGGKITVSVIPWEMYVEIKVADTGKGISESNQAAIFRRFYREEEVHEQQGVGIGLYLTREIVTRQGGAAACFGCRSAGGGLESAPRAEYAVHQTFPIISAFDVAGVIIDLRLVACCLVFMVS